MSQVSATALIPAPLWRRLAAMLYDSLLVFAIWIVVGFLVFSAFGLEQARTVEGDTVVLDPVVRYTLFSAMLLSAWLFFGFFWTHSGQTLGMQAWRVRVVDGRGQPIGWQQVTLRLLTAPPALLLGGIGYWWCLFDRERRSWPDLVSGSRIIRVPA